MCLSFFFEGVGGVSKKGYMGKGFFKGKREGFFRDSRRIQNGFLRRSRKLGKLREGYYRNIHPPGLVPVIGGGVLSSLRTAHAVPFLWYHFPELHHLRNNRHFLKSGDKTPGKRHTRKGRNAYLVSNLVCITS